MAQKAKKKSKLRHAEYYDMQKTFDSMYADSKSGEVFGHLMDIISAPSNIKLAFRNIKGNDGSHTAGTDGRTIESLAVMSEDKFVKLIQKQFRRYEPKAVKRVEIPKPNGKMRPLGIPCIIDRIVQQCILQVMEPICEAKFYEHSYGFRPCRSAENAISYAYGLAQRNKLHYVVDVDVKGFFDNVDHRKLLKQIWTLGIRDTKLIQIIKAMLKAPIEMPDGETVLPSKGTPQGGILSPLLANIVLNELDWWIASQWDEMVRHMKHPCKVTYYPNGAEKKCNSYTALKKSNLKEMRIVRYADDFKILRMFDKELHKEYVFCCYLINLLPAETTDMVDLEGKLKLEYYKLQKTFAGSIELEQVKGVYEPAKQKGAMGLDTKSPLDEIIAKINEKYKGEFTEGDKVLLTALRTRLMADKKLTKMAQTSDPQIFVESIFPKAFGAAAQDSYLESQDTYTSLFEDQHKYNAIMSALADVVYREMRKG